MEELLKLFEDVLPAPEGYHAQVGTDGVVRWFNPSGAQAMDYRRDLLPLLVEKVESLQERNNEAFDLLRETIEKMEENLAWGSRMRSGMENAEATVKELSGLIGNLLNALDRSQEDSDPYVIDRAISQEEVEELRSEITYLRSELGLDIEVEALE